MFITKIEAARRQLRTVLELWFSDSDPVSIHTLAYASHEIIHRLFRRKGLNDLLYDSQALSEEQRKEFPKLLKESANFFKHATREAEPNEKAVFNSSINDLFLIFSTLGLYRMKEDLNEVEKAFIFWLYLHNRAWFINDHLIKKNMTAERLGILKNKKKTEFLNAFYELKSEIGFK